MRVLQMRVIESPIVRNQITNNSVLHLARVCCRRNENLARQHFWARGCIRGRFSAAL